MKRLVLAGLMAMVSTGLPAQQATHLQVPASQMVRVIFTPLAGQPAGRYFMAFLVSPEGVLQPTTKVPEGFTLVITDLQVGLTRPPGGGATALVEKKVQLLTVDASSAAMNLMGFIEEAFGVIPVSLRTASVTKTYTAGLCFAGKAAPALEAPDESTVLVRKPPYALGYLVKN
jgi:hypothetical protein